MAARLKTAHLHCAPAQADDLPRLGALLRDPVVRRYLCDDTVLTDDLVRSLLDRSARNAAEGLGLWMLETPDGALVGVLGASPATGVMAEIEGVAGEVEVLIAIAPEHARQGLATEALERLAAYARDEVRLTRLVGAVDAPNAASHRMMRRAGFVPFGTHTGPAHEMTLYRREL